MVIRNSSASYHVGRSYVIKTSSHSMVRVFLELFPRKVPTVYGCIGVTDVGSYIYVVGGPSHSRKQEVNSRSLGITMAGKWKPSCYVKKNLKANKVYLVGFDKSAQGNGTSPVTWFSCAVPQLA